MMREDTSRSNEAHVSGGGYSSVKCMPPLSPTPSITWLSAEPSVAGLTEFVPGGQQVIHFANIAPTTSPEIGSEDAD